MKDISGQRFGSLVAARETARRSGDRTRYWVCWCDCGACTAASYGALTGGRVQSCGCRRLIGKKSGWLTVEEIRRGMLRCRCACGKEIEVPRSRLSATKSCGCENTGRGRGTIEGQVSLFPERNTVPFYDVENEEL